MKNLLFKLFGALKCLVPLLYLMGAAMIWLVFARTNPDGLANIWIVVYTLPIFLVGTFVLGLEFPYLPGGYYQAHALYFWPSVVFLAALLFLVFHGLQKMVGPRRAFQAKK